MRRWIIRFRLAAIFAIVLSGVSFAPAAATNHSTLVYESDTSTSSTIDPVTDGEYVVWGSTVNSVHQHCTAVNAARLDDRENFPVATIGDSGAYAIDDGIVVAGTGAVNCSDGIDSGIPGEVSLIDLATGESTTLIELGDTVVVHDVTISGALVAWTTLDWNGLNYSNPMIWAMEVEAGDEPTAIEPTAGEAFFSHIELLEFIDDELTWVTWNANQTSGHMNRAAIGDSTTNIWTMHDTSEVAISGDIRVTITEGRPLFHFPDASVRWLGEEGATSIATDGRYAFWAQHATGSASVIGYDSQTDARFTLWNIQTETPLDTGVIRSIDARNGDASWSRAGFGLEEFDGDEYRSAIYATDISSQLPSAVRPDPRTSDPSWTYYPESGHYLAGDFRDYWEANGGLPVFGYPLTEEYHRFSGDAEQGYATQMMERQSMEWHPENAGTPYEVLLGRLGAELLSQQGRDWAEFPQADPSAEHYFAETGHAIAPEFWDYWSSHGLEFGDAGTSFRESLALFGYPLSEPMMETNADGDTVLTQYFERAVFEYHPDHDEANQVLLRRLGAEVMASWGW